MGGEGEVGRREPEGGRREGEVGGDGEGRKRGGRWEESRRWKERGYGAYMFIPCIGSGGIRY